MSNRLTRRIAARDPNYATIKTAVRATITVPVNFAIGSQVIGNAQLATFAAFGSFALVSFAKFPGGRPTRFAAYLGLGLASAVLIALGTVLARPNWLAVVSMAVVVFAVEFAASISSMINAGTVAGLLTFILAVMLPGTYADIPARLAGWGLALVVCVPVALFLWPPDDQDVLRERAGGLCRALAGMLSLQQPADGDSLVRMRAAARELRKAFRISAAARTEALSTGARALIRLVEELEWLATVVANACADAPEGWPEQGRRLRAASTRALAACGRTLGHHASGAAMAPDSDLAPSMDELERAREAVAAEALAELRVSSSRDSGGITAGEFERPLYAAHQLGYAVMLAAQTVTTIAAADSRSFWNRLLGRGTAGGAQRAATAVLDRHSVPLQSSIRAAVGLALAVLLARVADAQNAFWIGLGALSVLRSNAMSTGATAARALLGTAVGFVIGGGAVALLGTSHAVLWTVFPIVVFIAACAPAMISFAAGQAAFTIFVIILFNIIAPERWHVGVVRIEDVALGCLASLVAGVLFWPRGATAALGAAYAEAYETATRFLRRSIAALDEPTGASDGAGDAATAAGARLDVALRQYLAERGTKHVPLESVTALASGAARLRLAGVAINQLHARAPHGVIAPRDDQALQVPAALLQRRADDVSEWYDELADTIAGRAPTPPKLDGTMTGESFLEVVLPAVGGGGDPDRARRAEQLLWSGQYLGDVDHLRPALVRPAGQVGAARSRRWWRSAPSAAPEPAAET